MTDAFFDVTVLDAETAAAFEQAPAGIEDSAGARALAEALGGLTLALNRPRPSLLTPPVRLGFADYHDALHGRGLRLFAHGAVDD